MTPRPPARHPLRFLLHSEHDFALPRRKAPVVMVRARGCTVEDAAGRAYLDAQAGLCLVNVGYGRAELVEAAARQLAELPYYHCYWRFAPAPAVRLAERLATLAPPGLEHVYFTPGGAEAVEAAIKLARLYHRACGRPGRTAVIAFREGYHGSTYGALSATGLLLHRQPFEPLLPDFYHVPFGDLAALEEALGRIGPERVAALLGEPIAAVGGVLVPPEGYWMQVRALCDAHDVLLIADEVLTGLGRCGALFCLHGAYGTAPDLLVLAKGLTSGYLPLGAVLVHRRVVEALEGAELSFPHGHTYGGHPASCAVALEAVEIVLRERLGERAALLGERMAEALRAAGNPWFREVRGRGLLIGVELGGPASPWPQGAQFAVEEACLARGLIVGACPYTPVIMLTPPLTIGEVEADRAVALLDEAVRAVAAAVEGGG